MTKSGILNPELIKAVASCGHTDYVVIGDSGLPIPEGPKVIDLSLVRGIPKFTDVLKAVENELVVESYMLAKETDEVSPDLGKEIKEIMGDKPCKAITHEELKKLSANAKYVIRSGEVTPYANIVLVCGVNF